MTTYYLSTDGDDANPGTEAEPFGSLPQLLSVLAAGDTGLVRGGTYTPVGYADGSAQEGTETNPITLESYQDESVVFDFGTDSYGGLRLWNCAYWELRGFTILNAPSYGLYLFGGTHHTIVENVTVDGAGGDPNTSGAGINLYNAPDTTVRNCVARNCYDPSSGGGNADGIAAESSPRAVIEDCVSHGNSDDGFDLWQTTETTLRRCWAFGNGSDPDGNPAGDGDGFKLGGGNVSGNNRIERCVAYGNRNRGFDDNTATRRLTVIHCTAFDNPINYRFGCRFQGTESTCVDHRLANNLSSDGQIHLSPLVDSRSNSWDLGLTDPGFISTDPDDDEFLRLSAASPAVDAGADIGLAYSGSAPDLGAFEWEANETTGER